MATLLGSPMDVIGTRLMAQHSDAGHARQVLPCPCQALMHDCLTLLGGCANTMLLTAHADDCCQYCEAHAHSRCRALAAG